MAPFDHTDYTQRTHERWVALLNERLAEHRETNDTRSLTEVQTAALRGRIIELKDLLRLAMPAPATAAGPDKAPAYRLEIGE